MVAVHFLKPSEVDSDPSSFYSVPPAVHHHSLEKNILTSVHLAAVDGKFGRVVGLWGRLLIIGGTFALFMRACAGARPAGGRKQLLSAAIEG